MDPSSQSEKPKLKVSTLISECKLPCAIIDVSEKETIENTLDKLLEEDILSILIYKEQPSPKQYIGFVSAYDLLKAIFTNANPDDEWAVTKEVQQHLAQPVTTALGLSQDSSSMPILTMQDDLSELLNVFTKLKYHRALVKASTGDMEYYIITQMDILRYFMQQSQDYQAIFDLSMHQVIHEYSYFHKPPSSVTITTPAFKGYILLCRNRCVAGAISVTDKDQNLIAELHAGDLRGLNMERFEDDLQSPVLAFLRKRYGVIKRPYICDSNWTVNQCVHGMLQTGSRRVWIIKQDTMNVEAVITVTDFLKLFLPAL